MIKKKILASLTLCILSLVCLALLSGCDIFATGHEITWNVEFDKEASDNASITVEGYKELPSKIPTGEEITVSIEGINGYKVHLVKVNNRKVKPNEDGKYVFSVTDATEVKITLREKVASVKMPDMSFFAGESIDRKAVQAEIVYATGRTEKTNKYSVVYQSEEADSFSLGDTYYSVKVSADRENLYKIDLKETVCCKAVINPHGGVIADGYFSSLETNSEIENLTAEDDGSISFTFSKPLTEEIPMPTADQISKGVGDDFIFQSWSASIPAGTDSSVTVIAVYKSKLLTITSIKLESREIDGENVPYLVVNGTFNAATSAYLYLNEGNKMLELSGPVVGGENTQRGDSFELLFDMRETHDKELYDYWLDVKFRAEVAGYVETQEINLTEYAEGVVDLTTYIQNNGYRYEFQVYADCLKVETSEYFENNYTMSSSIDESGDAILTIAGTTLNKYSGNHVKIDIEYDINDGHSTVETHYCEINELGAYSVALNLCEIPIGCNAYIHFYIVDSIEEENIVFVGKENNLLNDWCVNEDLNSEYTGIGLITDGGIRCPSDDEAMTYYAGKGKWGGIVIFGKDDSVFSYSTNSAEIYVEDGRVMISVIGSYRGKKAEMEAEIALWGYDLMENPYAASNGASGDGGWTAHQPTMVTILNDDCSFRLVFDVTDIEWVNTHEKACYTFHLGRAGTGGGNNANPDLKLTGALGNSTVTENGKVYTIVSKPGAGSGADFWGCLGLVIVAE